MPVVGKRDEELADVEALAVVVVEPHPVLLVDMEFDQEDASLGCGSGRKSAFVGPEQLALAGLDEGGNTCAQTEALEPVSSVTQGLVTMSRSLESSLSTVSGWVRRMTKDFSASSAASASRLPGKIVS